MVHRCRGLFQQFIFSFYILDHQVRNARARLAVHENSSYDSYTYATHRAMIMFGKYTYCRKTSRADNFKNSSYEFLKPGEAWVVGHRYHADLDQNSTADMDDDIGGVVCHTFKLEYGRGRRHTSGFGVRR